MTPIRDLGTYVEHEARPAVRFVRVHPHPAAGSPSRAIRTRPTPRAACSPGTRRTG